MPKEQLNQLSGRGVISERFRDELLNPSTRAQALEKFMKTTALTPEELKAIKGFESTDWAGFNGELENLIDQSPI